MHNKKRAAKKAPAEILFILPQMCSRGQRQNCQKKTQTFGGFAGTGPSLIFAGTKNNKK